MVIISCRIFDIFQLPLKKTFNRDHRGSQAELVFNNFSIPVVIKFPVKYTLSEIKIVNGLETAIIDYSISYKKIIKGLNYYDLPLKIYGKNNGRIIWDIQNKRPYMMDDDYSISFIHSRVITSFVVAEFKMSIETTI